jgi:hypothetical protein
MKILALVLLVCPLWACQSQGRFQNAGRNVDDAVRDVREGAKDVIEDVREGAEDLGDDRRSRRRLRASPW